MKFLMLTIAIIAYPVRYMKADGNKDTFNSSTEKLNKFIRCPDCGEQILMVPVLSQMIEAIELHLASHKDHPKFALSMPRPQAPAMHEDLAEQVLLRAAEIGDTLSKKTSWINLE
jgi:DNA-directed RNA polymerase subunit RPC12/RpoP